MDDETRCAIPALLPYMYAKGGETELCSPVLELVSSFSVVHRPHYLASGLLNVAAKEIRRKCAPHPVIDPHA